MLKQQSEVSSIIKKVRFLYIVAFITFTLLNKFIYFLLLPQNINTAIYTAFALAGGVLLIIDLCTRRLLFRVPYNGFLLFFFAIFILSSIVNMRYGITSNIKTFVWMFIQVFIFCAVDDECSKEDLIKQLKVIMNVVISLWFIGALASFAMYILQFSDMVITPEDPYCPVGFISGRLFGMFSDPNVAAVVSLLCIVFAFFCIRYSKNKIASSIYYGITMLFQLLYLILSASRTGMIIAEILLFISLCFVFRRCFTKAKLKRLVKSVVIVCISGILCVGSVFAIEFSKQELAYLPKTVYPAVKSIMNTLGIQHWNDSDRDIDYIIDMRRPDTGEDHDVTNSRFKIWKHSFELFLETPVLGTSPRNHLAFAEEHLPDSFLVKKQYSVHNGYLSLLVYTGILGAGAMLLWMGGTLKTAGKYFRRKQEESDGSYTPAVYMFLGLSAIAVSAFPMMGIFFGNSIIELLFWLLLGYMFCFMKKDYPGLFSQETFLTRAYAKMQKKMADTRASVENPAE